MGTWILSHLGVWIALAFVGYCVWLEFKLLRGSCRACYYWGRRCGTGRGILCSWIFKRETERKFDEREVRWADLLPDLLLPAIPLAGGIGLLIIDFRLSVLAGIVVLLLLAMPGNALVRGKLMCAHCRQRELGCPALKFFEGQEAGKSD